MTAKVAAFLKPSAFRDRVIGITGGAGNIGSATARHLLKLQARVAVLDRNQDALDAMAAEIDSPRLLPLQADLADLSSLGGAIEAMLSKFGRCDGWVNNAAVNPVGPLEAVDAAKFATAWQVGVQAAWEACRLVVPAMRTAGGGSIVNVSSVMAHGCTPRSGAYVSAKLALEGLTSALAVELGGDRVRVNTVVPGMVPRDFPMRTKGAKGKRARLADRIANERLRLYQPMGRPGRAGEVASAIVFLLSPAAEFVSGATWHVDGGRCAWYPDFGSAGFAEAYAMQDELDRQDGRPDGEA